MNHNCESHENRCEEDRSLIWGTLNGILIMIGIAAIMGLAVLG